MDPAHEALQNSRKLEGRYSNYFKVGHNAFEFVLEFGQFYPKNGEAKLHTRIVTSPNYTKDLLETLWESIQQYEKIFGKIQEQNFKTQADSKTTG